MRRRKRESEDGLHGHPETLVLLRGKPGLGGRTIGHTLPDPI